MKFKKKSQIYLNKIFHTIVNCKLLIIKKKEKKKKLNLNQDNEQINTRDDWYC